MFWYNKENLTFWSKLKIFQLRIEMLIWLVIFILKKKNILSGEITLARGTCFDSYKADGKNTWHDALSVTSSKILESETTSWRQSVALCY